MTAGSLYRGATVFKFGEGCVALVLVVTSPAFGQEVPLLFERNVRPVLAKHCLTCHGGGKTRANLDLRTVTSMLRGGDGGPALVRGQPEASPLIDLPAKGEMPPGKKPKLTPPEVECCAAGSARGRQRTRKSSSPSWSALPTGPSGHSSALTQPRFPAVRDTVRMRTSVDAFLLAKLEARKLDFPPGRRPVCPAAPTELRPDRPAPVARRGGILSERRFARRLRAGG